MFVAVGGVQGPLCFVPVHAGEGNTRVDGTAGKKRKQKDVFAPQAELAPSHSCAL